MKLVKSIVRPDKVDDVREALEKLKLSGMTVTDVRGHGRQKGHTAVYRGQGVQRHAAAEGPDRGRRPRQRRRRSHSSHHHRGADGRDRRRPRVRAAGRPRLQHPHRRAGHDLSAADRTTLCRSIFIGNKNVGQPDSARRTPGAGEAPDFRQENAATGRTRVVRGCGADLDRCFHTADSIASFSTQRVPSLIFSIHRGEDMNQADTAWMLISTALVLLMTPALAFFYGGLVRSKNALNTMMMSFISLGFVGVLWAVIGYSLAFAPGQQLDRRHVARLPARRRPRAEQGTIPHLLFMCFQGTFAIITAALISGAIVERMRFSAYVVFITLWALARLQPDRALGVGRRLARRHGRARLRRRHGRARQRRRRRARRRDRASASARTISRRRCCRTTCRSRCSAPACSGSDGSASTPAARWPPTASPRSRSRRRCWRRRARWSSGRSST